MKEEYNDFIEIYDNSVPQELCDELVEWFDLCSEKNFTLHNMPFEDGLNHIGLRSDEAMSIPCGIQDDSYPVLSDSLPLKIVKSFFDVLNNSLKDYAEKCNLMNTRLSCLAFKIHKVKEGQGYHVWHYENDSINNLHKTLAWMTYLKVPEEGGETEFLYQSKRITPVAGKTLIWPAYFTHLHRGNPPLKGEKYYITGWFERG